MADYFAVLQRTLSGFPDPKPELRSKLYERARSTIERQLASRNPPVTGEALSQEMDRLEKAIIDTESQYASPEPAAEPAINEPAAEPAMVEPAAVLADAEPEPAPAHDQQAVASSPVAPPIPMVAETLPDTEPAVSAPAPMPEFSPVAAPEPAPEAAPAPVPSQIVEQTVDVPVPSPEPVVQQTLTEASDPIPVTAPPPPGHHLAPPVEDGLASSSEPPVSSSVTPAPEEQVLEERAATLDVVPELPPVEVAEHVAVVEPVEVPAAASVTVDPVDEWAREFLAHETPQEPANKAEPSAVDVSTPAVDDSNPSVSDAVVPQSPPVLVPAPVPHMVPQASEPQPVTLATPADDLPAFDPVADDKLGIPPAPGYSAGKTRKAKKRGGLKWIFIALLAVLLVVAGYAGWTSRDSISEMLGIGGWFSDADNPQTPKKVKTITITPEKETPAPKPADATPAKPKTETRISPEDTGVSSGAENSTIKPVSTTTTPPVSQNAVLYEEGGTTAPPAIDRGRVVWRKTQQAPAEGQPEEPVIQGRIDIASRGMVIDLTFRRNFDKSLPASHVIDLIFKVPEDFSGGTVAQIRNLVFKETDQGQGTPLIGVPVQVSQGRFLIALNNLESAQKTNEGLMKDKGWFDIPMLYRTGRRAFITVEKGPSGDKIFNDVLAAWAQ